jgi:hypothetical protein
MLLLVMKVHTASAAPYCLVPAQVARHPGVLVRSVATTRTCCSGLQLLPAALVEAGLPAPSIMLLVVERDVVVESGFSTGAGGCGSGAGHRPCRQFHCCAHVQYKRTTEGAYSCMQSIWLSMLQPNCSVPTCA